MNKDFVTVPNASGNNNGSFDVTCEQNSKNERSTILTVSGGGVNKTIDITQKASNLDSIEIVGCIYNPEGILINVGSFGMSTDIKVSMTSPEIGRFIFPEPIQEMGRVTSSYSAFLRIKVSEEIPSHYKGEKVIAFLEGINGNIIYVPKKELTVDVYSKLGKNVFDLNIPGGIIPGNTEIININSALKDRLDIAILLTNHKKIGFSNLIWKTYATITPN